jgi:S1-C subfamily serine protease
VNYLRRNLIPLVVGLVAIAAIVTSTAVIVTRFGEESSGDRFAATMRAERGGAALGVQVDQELKVTLVAAGSAAEQAGVLVGDQIVAVAGQDVTTLAEVRSQLDDLPSDAEYTLTVNRAGRHLDLQVRGTSTMPGGIMPPQGRMPMPAIPQPGAPGGFGGPGVRPTMPPSQPPGPRGDAQGPRLGILVDSPRDGGVPVTALTPSSPAEAAGLRVGDVIIEANGTATPTVEALQGSVASVGFGGLVTLTVTRDGNPTTVSVRLAQRQTPTRPGA